MSPGEKDAGTTSLERRLAEETERARRAEEAAERALSELRTVRRRLEVLQREAASGAASRAAPGARQRYAGSRDRPHPSPPPATAPPPLRPFAHVDVPAFPEPASRRPKRSDPGVIPEGREPPAPAEPDPTPPAGRSGRLTLPPPLPPGLRKEEERGRAAEEDEEPWTRARLALLGVGLVLLLSVAGLAAWLAYGPGGGSPLAPLVLGGSGDGDAAGPAAGRPSPEDDAGADPAGDAGSGGEATEPGVSRAGTPDGAEEAAGAPAAAGVLGELPSAPEARAALYDSLWAARSEVFDPMLGRLEAASGDRDVEAAIAAWRAGGELDPLQADRLHSALLQLVLRGEIDADLALDGQVLRNPCRGESCSAFLNLWDIAGDRFGLPAMPDDAPRNRAALATAERALLLAALRDGAAGA